ncbi:MAG: succinyldiaminopimelate aminotransferase [Pseudomonadota bacterium]|jgi:succinyldiaminopimelate transaminase
MRGSAEVEPPDTRGAAVNDRLRALGDYPFPRLAALLADVPPRADTPPLVLSVGEPQHPAPALLAERLTAAAGQWNRYPPTAGTPDFRAAVADWLGRRYGLPDGMVDPDRMVLPVSGTREALYMLAQLAVPTAKGGGRPVVLMPNPFYAVYEGAAVMAGAEPIFLPAFAETGFLPDLDAVPVPVLERTALFYLCNPANPQGAIADRAYLSKALGLARRHGFVLVADECYAEIWDRAAPPGLLEVARDQGGDLRNLMVFHSLSKRSSAAGLRSGFCAGDPDLIGEFQRLRSYAMAGIPLPVLEASAALWRDEAHVVENRRLYREKVDAAERHLSGRFGFHRPPGGFFLWLDVGDGEEAARVLWREAAIRVLPGAYLTRPDADGRNRGTRFIRVALVHDTATVDRACRQIGEILG